MIYVKLFLSLQLKERDTGRDYRLKKSKGPAVPLPPSACGMEESFVITRGCAPATSGTCLWAGFIYAYNPGDVCLNLQTIFENTPATRAGMQPRLHRGAIIVAINGQQCFNESEEDRDGQAKKALELFNRLTNGPRERDPFTLTIRQPTFEEVRSAFLPWIREVLDKALSHDFPLPGGSILHGSDLLRMQAGVDILQRHAKVKPNEYMKMQLFIEEIQRRGWQGATHITLSFEIPSWPSEKVQELMQEVRRKFPEADVTSLRQEMAARRDGLSETQLAELRAIILAASPDVTTQSSQEACVVCLSNKTQVAILHGTTAHLCVCNECAATCRFWKVCPVCRLPVEGIRQITDMDVTDASIKIY